MVSRAVIALVVVLLVASSSAYVYLSGLYGPMGTVTTVTGTDTTSARITVVDVQIPPHSSVPPPGFNISKLLTGDFKYIFNYTVVIGINNTVRWVNKDSIDHTVSSFIIPDGAEQFNSGLIPPDGDFSTTLVVPGVYKYTCMWHPFLAGEIRVRAATP